MGTSEANAETPSATSSASGGGSVPEDDGDSSALALAAAAVHAGEGDPRELLEMFLRTRVYCPRPEQPGFIMVLGDPGEGMVPVFSSLAELGAFTREIDFFSTAGQDVLDLLPEGYDLVLDPVGDHPLRLNSAAGQEPSRLAVVAGETAVGKRDPQELFEVFLESRVFCPRPQQPGFMALGDPGDGVIPVFSSPAELGAFTREIDFFSTAGRDVLDLLPEGYDLVLDPAGDHPLRLNSAAVQARPALEVVWNREQDERTDR